MKYFVAMCALAAPLAMTAAVTTPAEAGFHGKHKHLRCHVVKKPYWRHGHKHYRFVRVCKKRWH
jgi:hypothetical protein